MTPRAGPNQQPAHGLIAVGGGWLLPAALVPLFLAVVYLSDHSATGARSGIVLALGALIVVGASVVAPRLIRGLLLRRVGWPGAIVLLGRGRSTFETRELPPRWRIFASTGGLLAPAIATAVAWRLFAETQVGTYPHAISGFALATTVGLAIAALAPVPGFGGWSLLVAGAHARGVPPDGRVGWAANGARLAGLGIAVIGGLSVAAAGHPMFIPFGGLVAGIMWMRAGTARSIDTVERFFARHAAGELAQCVTAVRRADEEVTVLGLHAREEVALVVDDEGALLGVVGPRQIRAALSHAGAAPRFIETMVPAGRLRIVEGTAPGSALTAELVRQGFAVVRDGDRYGIAEAVDIGRQIRNWALVGSWSRRRPDPTGVPGA